MGNTSVPLYVMAYAPIVVLDKGDLYYPSDLASHVANTHPTVNFTSIEGVPSPLSLVNLDSLNALGGDNVYLTSTHNVLKLPKFINGKKPDARTLQTKDAISSVIICVDKGNGILDAFYIYFYSFNEGPVAIGHRIGNHLGDWEHNMVRFQDGKPVAVWFSQHEYGDAYTYEAVQKVNNRPIVFSARGSHANYAKVGKHDLHDQDEKIPKRIVYDHTSYGPLWDPTLSAYYYTFSMNSKELFPGMDDMPVSFLNFQGWWGDQQYGDDIVGQEWYYGFYKWTGGPQGPIFKHLDRQDVCLPSRPVCIIKKHI
ncbi:hypothetical protein BJ878DRAFT_537109 [Calycina marina]|uniref:Vacuolar protein sorting-associated protein 62 n=1 Tax=Calycina marina TaxID=1763456 RepID=A0A9P7YVF3_9HELO|nr:hypothetical protein BJ878DRAFT_537109 [Calycina marina]